MMPPPLTPEGAGGHDENAPGIIAVYAEKEKPARVSEAFEAFQALKIATEEDWPSPAAEVPSIETKSEDPSSEVIDADDFVEDVPDNSDSRGADGKEPPSPEGKEYLRNVSDSTGIKNEFVAAGGARSDTPPPLTETNTSSSLLDLKRKEVQGRLKMDFDINLPDSIRTMSKLDRIESMVYGDSWSNDDDTRRTLRILLVCIDPSYGKVRITSNDFEDLKRAFKAELDKRRKRDSTPGSHKKGPPPLPR